MKRFSQLFNELDSSTATLDKVAALKRYFANASAADAAWATYFLAGGKPRQVVKTAELRTLAREVAQIPEWIFDECYQAVGDLAETISLVLPSTSDAPTSGVGLAEWIESRLLPLKSFDEAERASRIRSYWSELDTTGRFLLTKLIGGGFRVGVSKLLVQRALAEHIGIDAKRIAERMMGFTDGNRAPTAEIFLAIIREENVSDTANEGASSLRETNGQPYPFFLAHALQIPTEQFEVTLGSPNDWIVEWKYDGIRAQVVRRGGKVFIWSRGEELITDRFPEIVASVNALPDGTVLDGEILVWKNDAAVPSPFALLQQRIGRKTLTKKILADVPAIFMAYDVLENEGLDQRSIAQLNRRLILKNIVSQHYLEIRLSPDIAGRTWTELAVLREESRGRGVEGFMLKHRDAAYGAGRTKADACKSLHGLHICRLVARAARCERGSASDR
jgi:DNA ligase 1